MKAKHHRAKSVIILAIFVTLSSLIFKHKFINTSLTQNVDNVAQSQKHSSIYKVQEKGIRLHKQEKYKPETHKPEIQKPEIQKPEIEKPEIDKREMNKPEIDKPEIQIPEIQTAGTNKPEFTNRKRIDRKYIDRKLENASQNAL